MSTLVLFLTVEKWFQFFPIKYDVGYMYVICHILRYIPVLPVFIRKYCWILSKIFSASIEMTKWFLSLLLLMCYITLNDLHMLNHPWIPGMMPTWSWYKIFMICFGCGLPLFYWAVLHQYSVKEIGLFSPFWICPCTFWDECDTGFTKWVMQCFFTFCFMEKFKKCWY
jgi:hypothetical protein